MRLHTLVVSPSASGKGYGKKLVKFYEDYVLSHGCPELRMDTRACLKNHSRNLHASLCGIFCPNSVAVARCDAFIRTKFSTNCDAHLAESFLGARSSGKTAGYKTLRHKMTAKYNKTDIYNKKDLFITFIKKNL